MRKWTFSLLLVFVFKLSVAQISDSVGRDVVRITFAYGVKPFLKTALDEFTRQTVLLNGGTPDTATYYYRQAGPISLAVEYELKKRLMIGGTVGYEEYHYSLTKYNIRSRTKTYTWSLMAKASWYFLDTKRLDLFSSAALGYRGGEMHVEGNARLPESKTTLPNPIPYKNRDAVNYLGGELLLGLRLKLTGRFAVLAEGGIAKAPLRLGLSYINKAAKPLREDSPYY